MRCCLASFRAFSPADRDADGRRESGAGGSFDGRPPALVSRAFALCLAGAGNRDARLAVRHDGPEPVQPGARFGGRLAAAQAATLLAETTESNGRKTIVRTFADRDLNSLKLLAQKLTRLSTNAIALLAASSPQPSLVFAQSAGQTSDMGMTMKEVMAKFGGRGGGSKDMAQGGLPTAGNIEPALALGNEIVAAPKSGT